MSDDDLLEEQDWFDDAASVVDDRRVYAVVRNDRTAGELRALLGRHAGLRAVADRVLAANHETLTAFIADATTLAQAITGTPPYPETRNPPAETR